MPRRPASFDSIIKKKKTKTIKTRGTAHERGYDSRWQKARLIFLANNPLCVECKKENKIKLAAVVDHIKPHRGDKVLFWNESNWQSLCVQCHGRKTQRGE